ncbi:MAG: hypothetical protein ACKO3W_06380 [bacterium]
MSETRAILCPYCGDRQVPALQCRACGGRFDVWSLLATQNEMGAWYVRDPRRPHFVGFGYEALCAAIRNGEIGRDAIVRGPSTRQFWTIARRAPGLAHLFGRCYACQSPIGADDPACRECGAANSIEADRNFFGLPAYEPIAPPANAKPDHSAFIVDSGLLLIRSMPVRSPARTVVRVAPPVVTGEISSVEMTRIDESGIDPSGISSSGTSVAAPSRTATNVVATTPAAAQVPRSALSAIDRGLIERSRRLETWNRVLFGATAAGFAFALLFGLAYFVEVNERRNEVDAARRKGAEDVRAEFEPSAPVVVPPPAELPPMPSHPAAGGSGAKGAAGASSAGTTGMAGASAKDTPATDASPKVVVPSGVPVPSGSSSGNPSGAPSGAPSSPRGGRLRDQPPPGFSPPPNPAAPSVPPSSN